ncbi:MAG: phosphatidate cytidylyltransferase [Chitinispirillales bacterium]|jgi:phosphatidate cytidylyltransferase|nr:phosphatidate cytidylyltransferase [Chitinispirillales bacterium]
MINTANLKKRLVFPAVAVPVALVIVSSDFSISAFVLKLLGMDGGALPAIYPGQILALTIVLLGAYEYTKMLSVANKKNAFWLGYLWILAISGAYLFDYPVPATLSNGVLLMLVAIEAFTFGKEAPQGRWKRASLFFSGIIFLNIASISILSLYREPFQQLFDAPSFLFIKKLELVIVFTAVFMCDTAAYLVGSAWGKRKLTSMSPNKTIEGSLGGLAMSAAIMTGCWLFLGSPEFPIIIGVIMGILIGVAGQTGDLLASLMKRYFRVKDASAIIPGHGGILDRFDSLFFAAPVLYLFAWLLTR